MSLKEVIERVRSVRGLKVKAGILKGAKPYGNGLSVSQVAIWNEYGTSRSPSRPFMRTAVVNDADKWVAEFSGGLKAAIRGETSVQQATEWVGGMMQADIQKAIDSNIPPPNAAGTLKRKSSRVVDKKGKPISGQSGTKQTLIDTGHLLDSVSYEVINESS